MDDPVVQALREQVDELRTLAAGLDEDGLATPSACAGWSVSDVLLHLAQTNEMAIASVLGTYGEASRTWEVGAGAADVDALADAVVAAERGGSGADVRARWERSADDMVAAFAGADPQARVPWVVGDMAARTLATTRLAESWIHTGDVAEGLAAERPPSDRIWHICRLVHRTVPYAFTRSGQEPPTGVRFELTTPEDPARSWTFGDEAAETVVRGPALDLCRVAGQRAVAAATALVATGPAAADVLALMRTFA